MTLPTATEAPLQRGHRRIWPVELWPAFDRGDWMCARLGTGPGGRDNPSINWCDRTAEHNEDGYGTYLSWLNGVGLLVEDEPVTARITQERLTSFISHLKPLVSSVSVATTISSLASAARALSPETDWSWLSRRGSLRVPVDPDHEFRLIVIIQSGGS